MKKILILRLFAVSLYAHAQTEVKNDTPQPNWIKTSSEMGLGYIDTNGTVILNPVYEELRPFGEVASNLAVVVQDSYVGLIDNNGTIIVEPKYDSIVAAAGFNPNWLMVSSNGEFGFIDLEGNEVVPVVYDGFEPPAKTKPAKQGK